MPMYGPGEVQYWQITLVGTQRIQSGTLRGVGPAEKTVLQDLAQLGGMAETDELTVGGRVSPGVIGTSLRRLVDLGLVAPVSAQGLATSTPK